MKTLNPEYVPMTVTIPVKVVELQGIRLGEYEKFERQVLINIVAYIIESCRGSEKNEST